MRERLFITAKAFAAIGLVILICGCKSDIVAPVTEPLSFSHLGSSNAKPGSEVVIVGRGFDSAVTLHVKRSLYWQRWVKASDTIIFNAPSWPGVYELELSRDSQRISCTSLEVGYDKKLDVISMQPRTATTSDLIRIEGHAFDSDVHLLVGGLDIAPTSRSFAWIEFRAPHRGGRYQVEVDRLGEDPVLADTLSVVEPPRSPFDLRDDSYSLLSLTIRNGVTDGFESVYWKRLEGTFEVLNGVIRVSSGPFSGCWGRVSAENGMLDSLGVNSTMSNGSTSTTFQFSVVGLQLSRLGDTVIATGLGPFALKAFSELVKTKGVKNGQEQIDYKYISVIEPRRQDMSVELRFIR